MDLNVWQHLYLSVYDTQRERRVVSSSASEKSSQPVIHRQLVLEAEGETPGREEPAAERQGGGGLQWQRGKGGGGKDKEGKDRESEEEGETMREGKEREGTGILRRSKRERKIKIKQ